MKIIKNDNLAGLFSVFTVLLFAIYPVIFLYAHNVDQLVLGQLFLPIVFSLVLSVTIFGLCLLILKNLLKAGLSTVIFLVIFWNYGLVYMGIAKIVNLKHWHLIPILFFLYFHLVYLIAKIRKQKTLSNLNTILLLPILLLILLNIVIIVPVELRKSSTSQIKDKKIRSAPNANKGKYHPDIYLIILDEYAGLKTIKEEWGYDNNSFADFLRDKGFYIAEGSEARYNQTTWNISCLLNLDYLTKPVERNMFLDFIYNPENIKGSENYSMLMKIDFNERMKKINNNLLTNFLKEHGYKIVVLEGVSQHYPSFNIHNADITFSYQDVNKSDKFSFLINAFYMELIRRSMIFPFDIIFKIDKSFNIDYDGTRYVLNYLKSNVHNIESPKFIYAHILCPHGPCVFDRSGNFVSPIVAEGQRDGNFVVAKNTINKAYLEQFIYVTNEVTNVVNSLIPTKSPVGAVCIIQSDHGPRPQEVYLKDKINSFKVFNAVYFPDGECRNFYDSIAPVNTLRVVLNKYFGTNYKMLEDK